MNRALFVVAAVLCLAALVSAKSDVVELDQYNFDKVRVISLRSRALASPRPLCHVMPPAFLEPLSLSLPLPLPRNLYP